MGALVLLHHRQVVKLSESVRFGMRIGSCGTRILAEDSWGIVPRFGLRLEPFWMIPCCIAVWVWVAELRDGFGLSTELGA